MNCSRPLRTNGKLSLKLQINVVLPHKLEHFTEIFSAVFLLFFWCMLCAYDSTQQEYRAANDHGNHQCAYASDSFRHGL